MTADRTDEPMSAPTDPPLEAGYLDHGGARLFFESAGDGDALVLVHAGIADHTMWDPHLAALARRRRVLRYDLRGFGKSVTDPTPFRNGDDLLALLDHLAIERAALVGVSYGSRAVLEAALFAPERVAALVVVSPSLTGLDHEPTAEERALLERDEALGAASDWAGMADNDVALWVDGPGQPPGRADPWVRQKVKAMALGDYVDYQRRYPDEALEPQPLPPTPLIDRLGGVRAPTLVVLGALDTSMTAASADALMQGVAGAQKSVIADCAHMLPLERPQLFVDTVLGFLDRAAGA
jgi:pimeloyl-ACP methyl ester carboxylesterase